MHDFNKTFLNRASSVCIIFLVCCVTCILGEYDPREASSGVANDRSDGGESRSCIDGKCTKRTAHEITSGLWFGPRLGKRRRSYSKTQLIPDIEAMANMLDEIDGWILVSIPADKRQIPAFTPRLGRESDEELLTSNSPRDQNDGQENDIPPFLFTPHLGRRLTFSPSPRFTSQLRPVHQKI